ncbi:MAG: DUF2190 family protein [Candidatus Omnitrophica bacterium]|nr:DUF2190 family protein [Candidatus Omnitrophota bacterium]
MANETLLQMRSPVCKTLDISAPSPGTTAGKLIALASGLVGVAVETKDTAESVAFIYQADKIVVKKAAGTGKTISQGGYVYYNSSDNAVYGASASGRRKCGIANLAGAAADTTIEITLDGTMWITAQTS